MMPLMMSPMSARASALAELKCRATAQLVSGESYQPGIVVGPAYRQLLKRSLGANDDEINDRSKVQKADGTIKTTGGRLKPGCDTARKHTERTVEGVTPADFPEVRRRLG